MTGPRDRASRYTWSADQIEGGDGERHEFSQGYLAFRARVKKRKKPPAAHGGKGSGWFGPPKGTHGKGSQGGDKGADEYQVGLTSYRPGREFSQVKKEMGEFEGRLGEVADDVNVQLGTGAWATDSEPTWITEFDDGDDALSEIASTAKRFDQDSALIMKYVSEGVEGAQPQVRLQFDDKLGEPEIGIIHEALVDEGLGGWTWMKGPNGGTTLMAVSVPQWGGEASSHLDSMRNIRDIAEAAGLTAQNMVEWVLVDVMENGDYDRWIQ